MKHTALAAFIALGFATGVAAQASRESVPVPEGRDRTNQVPFAQADANKDGQINREEGNMIAGFDFSRADTDNNLYLSRAEYDAALARSTSRGEASPARTAAIARRKCRSSRPTRTKTARSTRGGRGHPGFNFTSADVDDNESVSRQEFQTAMANSTPRG